MVERTEDESIQYVCWDDVKIEHNKYSGIKISVAHRRIFGTYFVGLCSDKCILSNSNWNCSRVIYVQTMCIRWRRNTTIHTEEHLTKKKRTTVGNRTDIKWISALERQHKAYAQPIIWMRSIFASLVLSHSHTLSLYNCIYVSQWRSLRLISDRHTHKYRNEHATFAHFSLISNWICLASQSNLCQLGVDELT